MELIKDAISYTFLIVVTGNMILYTIITNYIDKYTTAYNSEIVMANLSHDN